MLSYIGFINALIGSYLLFGAVFEYHALLQYSIGTRLDPMLIPK